MDMDLLHNVKENGTTIQYLVAMLALCDIELEKTSFKENTKLISKNLEIVDTFQISSRVSARVNNGITRTN